MPRTGRVTPTRGGEVVTFSLDDKKLLAGLRFTPIQKEKLKQFVFEEGKKLEGIARRICPVGSGRLRDSHRTELHVEGDRVAAIITAGGISVRGRMINYAAAVHEGVKHEGPRGHKAQPWLMEAWKVYAPTFMQRVKNTLKLLLPWGGS